MAMMDNQSNEMRTSDGFINATKMCSSAVTINGGKKLFKDCSDAQTIPIEPTNGLITEDY
jgi:hypothetical protein